MFFLKFRIGGLPIGRNCRITFQGIRYQETLIDWLCSGKKMTKKKKNIKLWIYSNSLKLMKYNKIIKNQLLIVFCQLINYKIIRIITKLSLPSSAYSTPDNSWTTRKLQTIRFVLLMQMTPIKPDKYSPNLTVALINRAKCGKQ